MIRCPLTGLSSTSPARAMAYLLRLILTRERRGRFLPPPPRLRSSLAPGAGAPRGTHPPPAPWAGGGGVLPPPRHSRERASIARAAAARQGTNPAPDRW